METQLFVKRMIRELPLGLVLLASAVGHSLGWGVEPKFMEPLPSNFFRGSNARLHLQDASPTSNSFVPGKRWAIIIGAQDYSHYPKLGYARRDAQAVHKLLLGKYGFSADSTKLLLDSGTDEARPTAGNILGELEDLLQDKRLDKSDLFVFYFAGHGIGTANGDLLLPTDARPSTVDRLGLPTKEIVDKFTRAGLNNVLIIADACRSGEQNPFGRDLVASVRGTNLAVMLASSPGEPSYESDKLQHGYFTFELLNALNDETILDSLSGALWASALAKEVSDRTEALASRDQGSSSQKPEIYLPRGHDILLLAKPPKMFSGNALNLFMEEASKVSPENYGSVMNDVGAALFKYGNFEGAARVIESARRLGQATPRSLYQLGVSLNRLSREVDSNKAYTDGFRMDTSGYYGLLCAVCSKGKGITAGERLRAAKTLWEMEPDFTGYLFASVSMNEEEPEWSRLHTQALASKLMSPGEILYVEARWRKPSASVSATKGKLEEALRADGAPKSLILSELHYLTVLQMDESKCKVYETQIIENAPNEVNSYLVKASCDRFYGRFDEAAITLQKAADLAENPNEMLRVLAASGMHLAKISHQFASRALNFPRSWRADVVTMFANVGAGEPDLLNRKWAEAKLYSDDDVEVALAAADILGGVGLDYLRMSEPISKSNPFFSMAFLCLLEEADSFADHRYAWRQMFMYGLNAGRHVQLREASKKMPTSLSADPELKGWIWNLQANTLPLSEIPPPPSGGENSPFWLLITLLKGETEKTLDLVKKLPKDLYDSNQIIQSLHALALARSGSRAEATKLGNTLENVVGIPALVMGIVHKELGEDKEALLDFTVGVTTIDNLNWTFAYNEALLEWLEMIVDKDRAAVTRVAHEIYGDSPGLRIAYPGKRPEGLLQFDAAVFLDFLNIGGEPLLALSDITLHITGKTVTGSMNNGSESHAVQATIDDRGTAVGSFKVGSRQYRFSGRLPSSDALSNDPILKEHGVWFIIYDERMNRFAINAKYRSPK